MNGIGAAVGGFGMKGMNGLKGLMGLSAKEPAKGAKAQPAQAKSPAEIGRDGALTRGQGFSQRDAFEPARQAQQTQKTGQPKTGDSQALSQQNVQQQSVQQGQQAEADKRAQQSSESRQVRQFQDAIFNLTMALNQATQYDEEDLRKKLREFQEWLKEMDAIFKATPAT
jgi:hypothetical protein